MNPGGIKPPISNQNRRPKSGAKSVVVAVAMLLATALAFPVAHHVKVDTDEVPSGEESSDHALAYTASDDRMLVRLYFAYFKRSPDQAGFDYWRDRLITGATGQQISEAFSVSEEFVLRYGHLTDEEFVSLVYRNVLGREAESEGHAYWVGQLRAGETRGEIMLGFSESTEFTYLTREIPTPYAPPLTTYEERGALAVAELSYDWQTHLPGWTIDFQPQRSGYFGLTEWSSKRITIYVRSTQSDSHLAHVIAHEVGHAIDVTYNSGSDRERWKVERGIDSAWWPGSGLADFSTGAGDFAEAFAHWQVGHLTGGMFQSTLAGAPDAGDRALLAELTVN